MTRGEGTPDRLRQPAPAAGQLRRPVDPAGAGRAPAAAGMGAWPRSISASKLSSNIPLTGANLKAARRTIYDAAIQTLEVQSDAAEAASRPRLADLRSQLEAERGQAGIDDGASLLPQLMAGDLAALKPIVSPDLPATLGGRIARAAGREPQAIAAHLHVQFITLISTSDRWLPFTKSLTIAGEAFTSQFTPLNQTFDASLAAHGQTGYACLSASLPVGAEAPVESRERATNAWHTRLRCGDAVRGETLFAAFRSGSFSEKGIEDPATRQALARAKAYDLLRAIAVEHVKTSEPGERPAILSGHYLPTITVVSTALLTSFFGRLDHQSLQEHAEALEAYHGRPTGFEVVYSGRPHSIQVRFNIINFNKAVNEFRWIGASRSRQQLSMNALGLRRLTLFKEEALARLDGAAPLAGANRTRIAKIEQLWARIETTMARRGGLLSGSGSAYELPALVCNLGHQLGAAAHFNCVSGKDRTGIADVECKLLAYQMHRRATEAQANSTPVELADLVPPYSGAMTDADAEAFIRLLFESGNLDIQMINTGVPGYKIRDGLMGRLGSGRTGRVLAAPGGQQVLREYLNLDPTVSIKPKEFTRLVNALSTFTGA